MSNGISWAREQQENDELEVILTKFRNLKGHQCVFILHTLQSLKEEALTRKRHRDIDTILTMLGEVK